MGTWATFPMDANLRKIEDTLRAYAMLMTDPRELGKLQSLPIHRFFHHRLPRPGTRLRKFYGDGFGISSNKCSLEQCIDAPIYTNEQAYPSLSRICKRAEYLLQPDGELSLSPIVSGLGDVHSSNIMIAPDRSVQGHHDTLYIDYEVAGFHSLVLDLVKPCYSKIFFSALISDILGDDNGDIQFHVSEHKLEITLGLDADCISKAVVEVKRRHLIEPLRTNLHAKGLSNDTYVPHFAHALFACALLTRSYRYNFKSLMRSIAVGVVLSQTTCWDELWDKCESLLYIGNGISQEAAYDFRMPKSRHQV